MTRALDYLWPLMEAPEPTIAAHVTAAWPAGLHQQLLDFGFLVRAADADRVLCPECHGHMEEVITSDGPGGVARFFVPCPEVVRACVPSTARQQWTVNVAALADSLAATLKLNGAGAELMPGRAWRLGRTTWQNVPRDVMLVRGLSWPDAPNVRTVIMRGRKPIVFVPQSKTSDDLWRGRVPPLLALSQVATVGDTGLVVDPLEIAAAIQDAEERATASTISVDHLKLLIRQQVKAEGKSSLSDDAFLAAYRDQGSVRQAAIFLSQQTGQDVSKDQVYRALQRAGGVSVVLNDEDSESIIRARPSARGRKKTKPHNT